MLYWYDLFLLNCVLQLLLWAVVTVSNPDSSEGIKGNTPQPLYITVRYNMILDITQINVGP